MKSFVALASLALVASVSAIGPVDPNKLPSAWCNIYSEGSCQDLVVPSACGANSTFVTDCHSTFSSDAVCTSFSVSCLCTPTTGGKQLDLSMEAFNKTFEVTSYNMCGNLIPVANSTGTGVVSGGYKPDGKRPKNETATNGTSTPNAGASATTSPNSSATGKSSANSVQMTLSTGALAVISLGLAMIPW
ncbi:hypothetical protein EDD11_007664 [Mortierella claussenii]|nr:hypothetical protein EDD11_007664 [Mortierella claussenii]